MYNFSNDDASTGCGGVAGGVAGGMQLMPPPNNGTPCGGAEEYNSKGLMFQQLSLCDLQQGNKHNNNLDKARTTTTPTAGATTTTVATTTTSSPIPLISSMSQMMQGTQLGFLSTNNTNNQNNNNQNNSKNSNACIITNSEYQMSLISDCSAFDGTGSGGSTMTGTITGGMTGTLTTSLLSSTQSSLVMNPQQQHIQQQQY